MHRRSRHRNRVAPPGAHIPPHEFGAVVDHALDSAGLRTASPEAAAWLSLVAYVRHTFTDYDDAARPGLRSRQRALLRRRGDERGAEGLGRQAAAVGGGLRVLLPRPARRQRVTPAPSSPGYATHPRPCRAPRPPRSACAPSLTRGPARALEFLLQFAIGERPAGAAARRRDRRAVMLAVLGPQSRPPPPRPRIPASCVTSTLRAQREHRRIVDACVGVLVEPGVAVNLRRRHAVLHADLRLAPGGDVRAGRRARSAAGGRARRCARCPRS